MNTTGSYDDCFIQVDVWAFEACPADNLLLIHKHMEMVKVQIYETFSDLGKWWGAILIPVGFLLVFFGYKLVQLTVAVMIFLIAATLMFLFLVLQVFSTSLNENKVMLICGFSFITGMAAAYWLARVSTKYGVAVLASCGFLSLSFMLVPLLDLSDFRHQTKIKMAIYVGSAIIGFLVGAKTARGI